MQKSTSVNPMKQLHCKSPQEWRKWLATNHGKETAVWLVFYKQQPSRSSLTYDSAVDEALCYGWIDSIIKKIDESKYARRFTPRKDNSKWSEINKRRAAKLIKSGKMTRIGLAKIDAGKKNGMWAKPDRPQISLEMRGEFEAALKKNRAAKSFFEQLASSYKRQYLGWISVAKRPETKQARIEESVKLLAKGEKLGMK